MNIDTIYTASKKPIRITPHAMECQNSFSWTPGPDEEMLAFVAAAVENGEIPDSGKPTALTYSLVDRNLGEPDGMSSIMDWVQNVTHTFTVFVRRLPGNLEVYLLTTFSSELEFGEWHYEENNGYDSWQAQQIAEHEQKQATAGMTV
ncbi:MAG: hypothetical protein KKB70_06255 [Proteobacteria bacterium]|nr:hypothetical protein [Pseudomonadota bacterium]